ncbi:hypothetical protein ACLB2K_046103 [Fragaria x ananassa]
MERYEILKDIGSGTSGVARLVRDIYTGEHFAVKFIERGNKIDENVQEEIMNHRSLKHLNVVQFKEHNRSPRLCWCCYREEEFAVRVQRSTMETKVGYHEIAQPTKRLRVVVIVSALHLWRRGSSEDRVSDSMLIDDSGLATPWRGLGGGWGLVWCAGGLAMAHGGFARLWLADLSVTLVVGDDGGESVVLLTPTHLAIVMEYAAGGELYTRICKAGRFSENEKVCHRDLKLENALLDDSTAPRVKICDFGSSKRTLTVCYSIPDNVRVSEECRDLLAKIFVAKPEKRIRLPEIKKHCWFLKNLPMEMWEGGSWESNEVNYPSQSIEEVQSIIQEARIPLMVPTVSRHCVGSSMAINDADVGDIQTSCKFSAQMI